jgi:hypothetical protein
MWITLYIILIGLYEVIPYICIVIKTERFMKGGRFQVSDRVYSNLHNIFFYVDNYVDNFIY